MTTAARSTRRRRLRPRIVGCWRPAAIFAAGQRFQDITAAAARYSARITEMLEYARAANMPPAIEPLHPAYAGDRACVNNTTRQARSIFATRWIHNGAARSASRSTSTASGGDPESMPQIARAGKDRLLAFHVCDWLVLTRYPERPRHDGEYVNDIKSVRSAVESRGFTLFRDRDFSNDWWEKPMDEVLKTCIERHRTVV